MAILTVDELREHVNSGLSDEALQRLLDAAEEEIVARAGAPGARTEYVDGGGRFLTTHWPIAAIGAIVETKYDSDTTLVATDYLHRSGYVLERLSTGDNSRHTWYGRVAVTYTPVDDSALREAVQIDLVRLMLSYSPGLTSQTIGSWSEQYSTNAAWNNSAERESILARLDPDGVGMLVV